MLASTTTLAAGINTPASTVILAEQEFIGEDERPFTVAEYKNMAGRGGRLGFNGTGKAIILAENPFQPASRFGDTVVQALRRWVGDEIAFWCRCKRAAILAEWMEGASIQGD